MCKKCQCIIQNLINGNNRVIAGVVSKIGKRKNRKTKSENAVSKNKADSQPFLSSL